MTGTRVVRSFLEACRDHFGDRPNQALVRLTGEFIDEARIDERVIDDVTPALAMLPPDAAAWLAVTLGSIVEGGVGLDRSGPPVIELYLGWVARLSALGLDDDDTSIKLGPDVLSLGAFTRLCQSVVTHLARMPSRRLELAGDARLLARLEALEEHTPGAMWTREALLRRTGTVLALHPPSGRGLRLRYSNVASCFHLFSLLQLAIRGRLPGGRVPDPIVAEAVAGSAGEGSDEGWWHYGHPRSPTAELGTSIWGESHVSSLPVEDGEQVMLLWPPLLGARRWSFSFFGPQLAAMKASVVVEKELSAADCRAWFSELGVAAGKRKWWRF